MPIIVSNDFPPESGGIQRVMSHLASGIAARGRELLVVAPRIAGAREYDRSLPFRVLRYRTAGLKAARIVSIVQTYLGALRAARDRATIASIWWPAAIAVAVVPKILRGRFVVLAHGSEIAPTRTGLRRSVMLFVYRRADVILANSRFTKALLARVGVTANVRLVTLAVDGTPIVPARAAQPTVVSVGRLIARKGFDRTIEAIATLASDFPDLRYVIVGAGPQHGALVALARELGVAERVTFLGRVSDDELHAAYANAWCFALPTRLVVDDVEGFGLVFLEAAMAELPSIGGTDSGAVDAIVDGETGYLVDGTDSHAIANALRGLLSNPIAAAAMGRRARDRALTFTWDRTVDEVLAALER